MPGFFVKRGTASRTLVAPEDHEDLCADHPPATDSTHPSHSPSVNARRLHRRFEGAEVDIRAAPGVLCLEAAHIPNHAAVAGAAAVRAFWGVRAVRGKRVANGRCRCRCRMGTPDGTTPHTPARQHSDRPSGRAQRDLRARRRRHSSRR